MLEIILKKIAKKKVRKRRFDMKIKSEEKTPVLKSVVEYKLLPKRTIALLVVVILVAFGLFLYWVYNYTSNEYERAIADYTKVLKIKPDDYETLKLRGDAYYDKGDIDRAIADYNEALRIKPDYRNALYKRGRAYNNKGYKDGELVDRLLRIFNKGYYDYNYDQAIEDFTAIIKIKPDDYDALYHRGAAYYNKGNYDKAIEDFTAVIKIKPDDYKILYYRGNAYYKKGNYDQAIEDWEAVLKIDPNNVGANENLRIVRQKIPKPPRRWKKDSMTGEQINRDEDGL